jgi:uncharacterized protein
VYAAVNWLVAGAFFLGSFSAALAGPLQDADAAFERGDYAEAMRLIRPLAEEGNPVAESNLAVIYFKGLGVPQDYAAAAKWSRLAAAQGLSTAQLGLGLMYANGQGVPQDNVLGLMWLSLAAEQGDQEAINNRNTVEARMTPAQIAEARKLWHEWKITKPVNR